MHSLLKKYPSKTIQQAGKKYKASGDTSDLSNILKKQTRVYKTISPQLQQKLHHMKSDIVDNLQNLESIGQTTDYLRKLENKRESLVSDLHKKMLDNVLEIANHNSITDLNEDDITIKDGKLYLCGTMFYGELLDEQQRTKDYLIDPENIINDGHQKAFKSLVDFINKLSVKKLTGYNINIDDGKFPGDKKQSVMYFWELCEDNKDFFNTMSSIIACPESTDISMPICVDKDDNVYYCELNHAWKSNISTNEYDFRRYMYKYEFLS